MPKTIVHDKYTQERNFFLSIKDLGVQKWELGNFCLSYQFPPKSTTKVAFFFELCKNKSEILGKEWKNMIKNKFRKEKREKESINTTSLKSRYKSVDTPSIVHRFDGEAME